MRLTSRAAVGALWLAAGLVVAADSPRLAATTAILVFSAVLLGLGVMTGHAVAMTTGVGMLVAAYALTLVGRAGVDGRAPLIAALVLAVAFTASWAVDPALAAESTTTHSRRAVVIIGAAAGAMGTTAALLLAVSAVSFDGWPAVVAATGAGGLALLLLLAHRTRRT